MATAINDARTDGAATRPAQALDREVQASAAAAERSWVDRLALAAATAAGAGLSPVAPGTVGTLVAIPLFLAVSRLPPALQIAATLAVVAGAIAAGSRAGRCYGHTDDQRIVSDEVAGYLVTMALVPATPMTVVAGFVLFRLFDITKPWPARWFDRRVHSGFGNVMDDVCAGLYARACLAVVLAFVAP